MTCYISFTISDNHSLLSSEKWHTFNKICLFYSFNFSTFQSRKFDKSFIGKVFRKLAQYCTNSCSEFIKRLQLIYCLIQIFFIWDFKIYFILILNYWINILINCWMFTKKFDLNRNINKHLNIILNLSLYIKLHSKNIL